MQQSTGSIGHSRHRKAFGSKQHKSALNHILLQKDENKRNAEKSAAHKKRGINPKYFDIGD